MRPVCILAFAATDYPQRAVNDELDRLQLSAAILEGAKAVGKTRTLELRARTVHRLDRASDLQLADDIEDWVTSGEPPILIDEFQRHTHAIDKVRRIVDSDYDPRQFYMAGSAGESADTHSGAGRILTIRIRPLSFAERQIATPSVSLGKLCCGSRPTLSRSSEIGLSPYVEEILSSGFPATRTLDTYNRRRWVATSTASCNLTFRLMLVDNFVSRISSDAGCVPTRPPPA